LGSILWKPFSAVFTSCVSCTTNCCKYLNSWQDPISHWWTSWWWYNPSSFHGNRNQ